MVTDTNGYAHLIQYLTENLVLFESSQSSIVLEDSIMEVFEAQLVAQIITMCGQHPSLSFSQRNRVIREVDSIVYDLEEIFAHMANAKATPEQSVFITDFAGLIKNLFDQEIAKLEAAM